MIFSDLPSPAEAGFAKARNRFPSPIKSRTSFSGSCAIRGAWNPLSAINAARGRLRQTAPGNELALAAATRRWTWRPFCG